MRYSLRTFIIACLFVSALIGIYLRRDPWIRDKQMSQADADRAATKVVNDAYARGQFPAVFALSKASDGTHLSQGPDVPDSKPVIRIRSADNREESVFTLNEWEYATVAARRYGGPVTTPRIWAPEREVADGYFESPDRLYFGVRRHDFSKPDSFFDVKSCGVFRRLYPAAWWGHFHRFEVWAAIVTGVALLVTAIHAIFARIRRKKQELAGAVAA